MFDPQHTNEDVLLLLCPFSCLGVASKRRWLAEEEEPSSKMNIKFLTSYACIFLDLASSSLAAVFTLYNL